MNKHGHTVGFWVIVAAVFVAEWLCIVTDNVLARTRWWLVDKLVERESRIHTANDEPMPEIETEPDPFHDNTALHRKLENMWFAMDDGSRERYWAKLRKSEPPVEVDPIVRVERTAVD
jgi:hypothetical protein